MRRSLALFCWLGLTPFGSHALGLGDIALDSALNQPFVAEIPLESYEEEDLKSLRVSLASADTFERYGLELPAWMQGFEFAVGDDSAGKPVVRITSQRPVAEPFVTLLLDIKWSSGRLLREYTVLLDPPLFEAAPAPVAVAPAETTPDTAAPATQSAGAVSRPQPSVSAAPAPSTPVTAPAPAPEPVRPAPARSEPVATAAPLGGGTYTVQRRETLWGIADRVRGDSAMTVNQVMLALYRANPDAFLGNINRLKAGAILRVPENAELAALSPAEATAAVRQQNAALRSPQPAADTAPAEPAQLTLVAPEEQVTDSAESTAAGRAPATAAAGLDAAAASAEAGRMQSRIDELESELGQSRRLLEARDAELAAMQRRLAVLEASREGGDAAADVVDNVADEVLVEDGLFATGEATDGAEASAETSVDTEAETPFAEDTAGTGDEDSVADVAALAGEDGAEDVAETSQSADPATTVAAREEQPSFLGSLLGNIWFWASAAVVLLLALFVARRGKRDDDEGLDADASGSWRQQAMDADHADTLRDLEALPENQDSMLVEEAGVSELQADPDSTSRLDDLLDDAAAGDDVSDFDTPEPERTTELQVPDEGDRETPLEKTISTGGLVDLDQADPIAEAEFHMAYGLYDQAAELLERSLEDDPDNRAYRAKLIEVFFVWENRDGFLTHARALHERIDNESDSDWNKVVILGKQLCPDDDLFSGDAAAPAADSMDFELTELGDDAGDTELDFTLGGAGNEVEALDADLLGGDGETPADSEDESAALDFDLGDELADALGGDDELALNLGEDDLGEDTDDSATTMESPTVEADMSDAGADTLETPTIESPAVGHGDADNDDDSVADVDFNLDDELIDDSAATMETPTIESDMSALNEPTLESPTLESAADGGDTSEMPALDADAFESGDLDLDLGGAEDLDVDLSGLGDDLAETGINESDDTEAIVTPGDDTAELPVDGAAEAGADDLDSDDLDSDGLGEDDATLLATGLGEDEATLLASGIGEDDETLIGEAADLEAEIEAELEAQAGNGNGNDNSSDTVEQPQIDPTEVELGETAQQPAMPEAGDVDFDLGMDAEAEDDVATAIQEASLPEDATMTEVGTKLDLARAYIDMGDPDGARSILNEVLDEGGDEQQQEARQLLEELGD